MIRNIVFDMGGVLMCFDADKILDNNGILDPLDREIVKDKVFHSPEWREYDRGTVEKESFIRFIDELPEHLRGLFRHILLEECFAEKQMPVYTFMEPFIGRLKKAGYKIYLLSNAGQDWYHYSKFNPCFKHFDGTFVSSDYKLLKPEPEIYEKFLDVFHLEAAECVFIDDVQANIDGAINAGMNGICYSSDRQNVSDLEKELNKIGVNVDAEN